MKRMKRNEKQSMRTQMWAVVSNFAVVLIRMRWNQRPKPNDATRKRNDKAKTKYVKKNGSKYKRIRENEWVIYSLCVLSRHTGVRCTTESIMHTNSDYARVRLPLIHRADRFGIDHRHILDRTQMAWVAENSSLCLIFFLPCFCFEHLPVLERPN